MRILDLLDDLHILQLDVEELVHALESAADGDVVLELDGDFGVDEGFEEAELRITLVSAVQRCRGQLIVALRGNVVRARVDVPEEKHFGEQGRD